ncbi:hypothetical protein K1719_014833 [Acacia pycnantha]|nr:hypothetical protein K1719_014833 [Acacia pycnantha]
MASSGGRAPELRKNVVLNRWVIFSPIRAKRSSDFKSKSPTNPNLPQQKCPFCISQEHETPEIFQVSPDNPNWMIRVIQDLYPALAAISTNHLPQALNLPTQLVLLVYKKRIEQLASHESIKYVQVPENPPPPTTFPRKRAMGRPKGSKNKPRMPPPAHLEGCTSLHSMAFVEIPAGEPIRNDNVTFETVSDHQSNTSNTETAPVSDVPPETQNPLSVYFDGLIVLEEDAMELNDQTNTSNIETTPALSFDELHRMVVEDRIELYDEFHRSVPWEIA